MYSLRAFSTCLLYLPSAVHRPQRAESDAPSVPDDGVHYADDIMRHLRDLETRCGADPCYIAEHRGVLTAGMREVKTRRRGCCCCLRPQRTSHMRTCARVRVFNWGAGRLAPLRGGRARPLLWLPNAPMQSFVPPGATIYNPRVPHAPLLPLRPASPPLFLYCDAASSSMLLICSTHASPSDSFFSARCTRWHHTRTHARTHADTRTRTHTGFGQLVDTSPSQVQALSPDALPRSGHPRPVSRMRACTA